MNNSLDSSSNSSSTSYVCKRCLKDYKNRTRLIRHLRGVRVCRVAADGEDIDRNILIDLARQISFKCPKCNETFATQETLDTHIANCIHDECFMKKDLIEFNDPFLDKIDDIAYSLAYIIKKNYFTGSIRYIKIQHNGYYKMLIEGKWTQVLKKVDMINIMLNKLACSTIISPSLIKLLLEITQEVKTLGDLSKIEWEYKKIYNQFFHYIFKLINNQKFLSPEEKYESIRKHAIFLKKNREFHESLRQKKRDEQDKLKKTIDEFKDKQRKLALEAEYERNQFNYLKDELSNFDDIDISDKNDEAAIYLAEKIKSICFNYREKIIDYFERKSRRKDKEEIASYLYDKVTTYDL